MSARRQVQIVAVFTALTTVACAALLIAAAVVPAPVAVLPFVVVACLGCPMVAAYELGRAIATLRDPTVALRRELERLPETSHPLGF